MNVGDFDQATLERLASFAVEVAISTPAQQQVNTFGAKVPWSLVSDIRTVMDAAGVDWRHNTDECLHHACNQDGMRLCFRAVEEAVAAAYQIVGVSSTS